MKTIILRIKEDDKAEGLLRVLRDISYVEIEESSEARDTRKGSLQGLEQICGLWRGREITGRKLRTDAWANRGVSNDTH